MLSQVDKRAPKSLDEKAGCLQEQTLTTLKDLQSDILHTSSVYRRLQLPKVCSRKTLELFTCMFDQQHRASLKDQRSTSYVLVLTGQ